MLWSVLGLALAVFGGGDAVLAGQVTTVWDGGGGDGNWNTANNWNPNGVPAFNNNANLQFGGTVQLSSTNNTGAATIIRTLTFNAGAGAFTLSGTTVSLANAAGIVNSSTSIQTISFASLGLTNASTSLDATSGELLINSSLTGNGFDVTGTRVTLTGSSSNTGASTVTSGTLRIQNSFALGTTAAGLTVAANAALEIANNISVGAEALTISGTGSGGGVVRSVSGTNSYGGDVTLAAASRINADAGQLTLSGTFGGVQNLTFGGAGNIIVSGTIGTGASTLTKDGAGTLTLSAPNTYTGLTTISGGTLAYGASNVISSGGITINGGVLDLKNFNDTVGTVTLTSGNILGTGTLTSNANFATTSGTVSAVLAGAVGVAQAASGTTVLTGANVFTGASTIAAGGVLSVRNATGLGTTAAGVTITSGGALELQGGIAVGAEALSLAGTGISSGGGLRSVSGTNSYGGNVTLTAASRINADADQLTLSGTFGGLFDLTVGGSGNVVLSGTIGTGANDLVKDGSGTLTLSAANTFSGTTTVSAGTLVVGNAAALQSSMVSVGTGAAGTLSFGNVTTGTFGGLTGGNNLSLSNTSSQAVALTVGGNNISTTYSGTLSGAGSLTKVGSTGQFTLSGQNTYTGTTAILSGTLSTGSLVVTAGASGLGNASSAVILGDATNEGDLLYTGNSANYTRGFALGGGGGQVIVSTAGQSLTISQGNVTSTSGTFTIGGAGNTIVSSTLAMGTGGLLKQDAGTLTLNAANTYTGLTTVAGGTLAYGVSDAIASGNVTVNGGVLDFKNFNDTVGTVTLTTGAILGTGTLTSNASFSTSSGTITAVLAGSGVGVAKTASGTTVLAAANVFTGTSTIAAGGVLNIQNAAALGSTATGTAAGTTITSGGALELQGGIAVGAETLSLAGTGIASGGALRSVSGTNSFGGDLLLSAATRINADADQLTLSGTFGGVQNLTFGGAGNIVVAGTIGTGAGTVTKDGAGTLTLSAPNTYSGLTTVSGGTLAYGASNVIASGGVTVNGGVLDLQNFNDTVGTVTLTSGRIIGTGTLTSNAAFATASGTISAVLAATGLGIAQGAGTTVLTAANTFTGTSTIASGGILNIRNSSALGTTATGTAAGTTITSGGALELQGGIAVGAETLSLAGTGVASGGALRSVSGTNSFGGDLLLSAAARINADADQLTLSGTFGGAQNLTFGGAGDIVVSGTIGTGAGTLTKDGAGTLTLTAANTYTGATTVSVGVINVQSATGLGTTAGGVTVSNGAALELQGGIAVGAEALSLAGTGIGGSGALLNVSGTNSYAGNVSLAAASQINSDAGQLTLSGTFGGVQNLTFGGAGNIIVSGTIGTGASTLTKDGAGTLTLSAPNTYTGLTTISGGTLAYGASNVIASGGITVNGGVLDLKSFSDTVGTVTLTSGNILGTGTLTSNANFATTSGTISAVLASTGLFGIAQAASGTTVLTAANTFTGTSTIASGGVLNIRNASALGTTATGTAAGTTITSGGALELQGGIAVGAETLTLGGTGIANDGALRNISGTNSWSGNLLLSSAARINSDADQLTLSGTFGGAVPVTFGGSGNIVVSGTIGLTGGVTKDGAGTLTLSAPNTYSGLTTVSGGTLALGVSNGLGGGGVTVNGGVLDLKNFNDSVGTVTLTSGAILGTGTLTSNANFATTSGTISAVLASTGLQGIAQGSGTTVLTGANTFTGTSTIASGGVLNIRNASALGTTATGTAAGTTITSGGALELQGGIAVGAETLTLRGSGIASGGALRNVSGTNSFGGNLLLSAATRINSDADQLTLSGTFGGVQNLTFGGSGNLVVNGTIGTGAGIVTKDGTGTLTLTAANTYTGSTSITSGVVNVQNNSALGTTGTVTVLSGAALELQGGVTMARSLVLAGSGVSSGGALRSVSGTNTYSGTIALGTGVAVGVDAGTLSLTGGVGNGAGSSFTKNGPGTLVLNSNDVSTGIHTINAGTYQLGANGSIGAVAMTLGNGATFDMNGRDATLGAVGNLNVNMTGASITTGTGLLSFNSQGVTLTTVASATSSTISGRLSLGGTTATFNVADGSVADDLVISATVSNGGFIKSGAGLMKLTGTNIYTGTTTVQAGTLAITNVAGGAANQALGTGTTVNLGVAGTSSGVLQYLGGSGTLSKNIFALGNGSDTIQNAGSGTLFLSGTLTKNGTVLTLRGGSSGITVTGLIVGSSSNSDLVVESGLTTLSNTNTYVGPTFIRNSGTLALGINNAIPSNSLVTIGGAAGPGTLITGTFTNAIGGLLFSGSGGTISIVPTPAAATSVILSATGAIDLSGASSLDLTGMPTSAGIYRLIGGSLITGQFSGTTGLDANYVVRYGTVNANEVDLQRKATQSATFTMTTGTTRALVNTSVAVSGTLTNSTPTGGTNLAVSLSSGGSLTVGNLASGTNSIAPQASTTVTGTIQAGATPGTFGWSVVNTDPNAIQTTATATGSLNVVNQREFTLSTGTFSLGRFLAASPTSESTSITSLGLSATTANATVNGFGASNGLTLSLTSGSGAFNGGSESQTAVYTLGGTSSTLGAVSGSFASTVTAELGSINSLVVEYSGTAVNQRTFTTSTSTFALGNVHAGSVLGGGNTLVVTSTGLNATTANATLGNFTGGPSDLALGLTSGTNAFVGATSPQTATYTLSGTASTLGSLSGTYTSVVAGEFAGIPNITVAVTGNVYSGQSTWATTTSGTYFWGTLTGTGANAFGANWGANQGSPGLDPGYTNTDTATFGSALTGGTASIYLNGANPSLKGMTFDNAAGSYAIYPSAGGTRVTLLNSGTDAATITVSSGTHAIHTEVTLGSATVIDVASNSLFSLHGTVSGSNGISKTGLGVLDVYGSNDYTGNTDVLQGILNLRTGLTPLGSGTVTIYSGATLDLNGLTITNPLNVLSGGILANTGSSAAINVDTYVQFTGTTNGTINVLGGGYGDFQSVVNQAVVTVNASGTSLFQGNVTNLATINVDAGGVATFSATMDGFVTTSGSTTFNGPMTETVEVTGGVATFNAGTDAGSTVNVASGLAVYNGTVAGIAHVVTGTALFSTGTAIFNGDVASTASIEIETGGVAKIQGSGVFQAPTVVNNGSVIVDRSASLSLASAISGSGSLTKLGTGALTLTGTSTFTGGTQLTSGTLFVDGSLASAVNTDAGSVLGGSGSIGGTLSGAGLVNPGTGSTPGVLSAAALDPTGGLDFAFQLSGSLPNYANPTSSTNDVLRLTDGSPFQSSLTAANAVDIYFNVDPTTLHYQQAFDGGFFSTLSAADLLAAVQSATFNFWVLAPGGGYMPLSYANTDWSGAQVTTRLVTVDFGQGPVTGSVTEFIVVPEPESVVLAGLGAALAGWMARKRRSVSRRRGA